MNRREFLKTGLEGIVLASAPLILSSKQARAEPIEDEYGKQLTFEKQFGQLLEMARKLPDHRYRFAVLYQFKEFDKAVWVMPGERRVKIITKNNT